MPLNLPNLDDRTYNDLVEEGRALIPTYAPEWTNHNPSDPGITLVELFAYLTEMLIYRVNRVTDANKLALLKLLNGPDWTPSSVETLTQQIREAVLELRERNRAITCEDFEKLASAADSQVARARCVPRHNLESESSPTPAREKPGHVSVIIVPRDEAANPQPSAVLIQKVKDYLEPRRLLTTQVHVVGPRYFAFGVRLTLVLKPDAVAEIYRRFTLDSSLQADLDNATFSTALRQAFQNNKISLSPNVSVEVQVAGNLWRIRDNQTDQRYLIRNEAGALNVYEDTAEATARIAAIKTLKHFLDPLTGGPPLTGGEDGKGWEFGRNVFVSEIYTLLDTQPGIDYVTKTIGTTQQPLDEFTTADTNRLLRNAQGDLVALEIKPDELIDVQNMIFDLTIQ